MNAIELLQDRIAQKFPSAQITLDPPMNSDGNWFLDIVLRNRHVVVEWRPKQGFGISDCYCSKPDSHGYGEGPDKTFEENDHAFQEVVRLLES